MPYSPVGVDENNALPPAVLAELGESFAPATLATTKLDKSEAATAYAKPVDAVHPAFRSIRAALDSGRSAAIQWIGDSTGDWGGSGTETTPIRMMRKLADAYPAHRVVIRNWNTTIDDYGSEVVIQAASGRRGAATPVRSLRHWKATPPQFTSGNVDVRALIAPTSLTPAANGTIVTRGRKSVGGVLSGDLQFELVWSTTGNLIFRHSVDGAAYLSDRISTATVPAIAGQPIWVRCLFEHAVGTGFSFKFYTAADGATWTQLGTTVSASSPAAPVIWPSVVGSFFEVGARGWQPAALPFIGLIHHVEIRDGAGGPLLAPSNPELWQRYPEASTTFTGSPTLTLLNSSRSGTDMSYHLDATRQGRACSDYGQRLVIFNDSHNEVGKSGPVEWIDPFAAWVAAVQAKLPNAAVAVVAQNPHTSAWANEAAYGYSHLQRTDEVRSLAAAKGWGLIDLQSAFNNDPRGVSALLLADGLHPNVDGYDLAGSVAVREFGIV